MKINNCRSCGSNKLVNCLNLGKQALTGIFPKNKNQKITSGNLSLLFVITAISCSYLKTLTGIKCTELIMDTNLL